VLSLGYKCQDGKSKENRMYKIGDVIIPNYGPWTHPISRARFPANWIEKSTEAMRTTEGIVTYPDPEPPAPPIEEVRAAKMRDIESRTNAIFAAGVPARVSGVWKRFDTRTGERAASNWAIMGNVINMVLNGAVAEGAVYPMNVVTLNDAEVLALADNTIGAAFWAELMTFDKNIAASGSVLRKRAVDATTVAEINAIVDNRPIPYPFPS
jgi:hypothetical protein